MGGSLSEPSTLVDLQEEIRLIYSTEDVNGSLEHLLEGLSELNLNFQDIIQGVQHVDDAAFFFESPLHPLLRACHGKTVAI